MAKQNKKKSSKYISLSVKKETRVDASQLPIKV